MAYMKESASGYPFFRWGAIGDLDHAEAECCYPALCAIIREVRLAITEYRPFMSFEQLILTACWFDDPRGEDLRLSRINSKSFPGGTVVGGYWQPDGLTELDRVAA